MYLQLLNFENFSAVSTMTSNIKITMNYNQTQTCFPMQKELYLYDIQSNLVKSNFYKSKTSISPTFSSFPSPSYTSQCKKKLFYQLQTIREGFAAMRKSCCTAVAGSFAGHRRAIFRRKCPRTRFVGIVQVN